MYLATTIYKPDNEVKGCVQIVHGMEEHRKRYEDFANTLKENCYGVISYDLPGHGETAGDDYGYFGDEGWQTLIDSVEEINKLCHETFGDVPVYLFGHSMGSMVSRCYIQQHDQNINGLILSGAPNYQKAAPFGIVVGNILKVFKGKKGHSKLLDSLITGSFNKKVDNPRTPSDWISYNEENVDQFIEDPLSGVPFTIGGYIHELEGMVQMHDVSQYECKNKNLPILFVVGEDDPCTGGTKGLEDSKNTLVKAGYSNIKIKQFSHMRHDILNEIEKDEVKNTIIAWLNELSH